MKRSAKTTKLPLSAKATEELHLRAEAELGKPRLGQRKQKATVPAGKPGMDAQRLVHELEVHQVELEMQNAELQAERDKLEALVERYTDLYDFAPVGYFTLDREGTIAEANLTAASLLGVARTALVKRPFGAFVSPADRSAFAAFRLKVVKSKVREECDIRLQLKGTELVDVRIRAVVSSSAQACQLAVSDITAHKLAEEIMRESEERFRVMANAMSQMAWIARPDGHVFWYNQRWHDYTGTTPEQMEGWGWQSVHDPVVLPKMVNRWKQSLATGADFEMTFPLRGADGSFRTFLTRGIALKDAAGRVVQWVGTNTDVTDQKLAEDKVRVSEIRYRRLFEAAHDGVLLLDPGTRKITEANPFMTKLLGYPQEQLVGKELFEIGLLKDEAASQEMFRKLKKSHEVRYEDLPLESREGRHQEVEVVANLYQENDHSVIQCNIRDITTRKAAELGLQRLAAIVEFSDDAIIGKSPTGIITSWNHGAQKIFGYTAREMVGASIMRLIPAGLREEEEKILARLRGGDSVRHTETHRLTKDGRLIHVSLAASPIKDDKGRVIGISKVARDITERKLAEDAQRRLDVLAASNAKLEQEIVRRQEVEETLRKSEQHQTQLLQQARAMRNELRQLSHHILHVQEEERKRVSRELHDEIGQTLVGINVHLAGLADDFPDSRQQFRQKIAQTRKLVAKSVEVVHRFARELRPTVLDDLGLIPALLAFLKEFNKRTGVRTNLSSYAAIEKLSIAKRTVLYRVAYEALNNVAQHAEASRVTVSFEQSAGHVCMTIKDDGKAFPTEKTLPGKQSNRLGLLGMRERLEMVGGSFEISSAVGQGTRIVARIPLGAARSLRARTAQKTG